MSLKSWFQSLDLQAIGVKVLKGGLYGAAGAATGLTLIGLHDWRSFAKGAAGAILSGFLHGAHEATKQVIEQAKESSAQESVYLAVTLDAPSLAGISTEQPRKPWILVTGANLKEVAKQIPRINWHTVPMGVRSRLELGDQSFSCTLEDAKRILEGL